ncbi:MAG: sigma-70 family RNA polymerase sigma factor [Sedimentisphaerales bacterium]|nr:sigma-70 family RNA polymerase sigma factor [Sedimentisphaerales bacterium]
MAVRTAIQDLLWTGSVISSVDRSQRWILSAMQKQGPGLITMLWRILGNEQDVCDIYQQTFLKLAHFRGDSKPDNISAYLYRTAANEAITLMRRAQVHRRSIEKIAPSSSISERVDYAYDLDAKALQTRLRQAISRLPDYLREVVALRDLAELSYSQVGQILGITPATARVYRCKAIAYLSRLMGAADERE